MVGQIEYPKGLEAFKPEQLELLKKESPYFDANKIEESSPKYVTWVDLMGARSILDISSRGATIHIGKLHVAALKAQAITKFDGRLYCLVDGIYITSEDIDKLQTVLKALMRLLMIGFLFSSNENKCLVRGAISYGRTIEGADLTAASSAFSEDAGKSYIRHLVVGTPLARAYKAERNSPVYGIWIDDNARHFSPNSRFLPFTFWKWWDFDSKVAEIEANTKSLVAALWIQLEDYFTWCEGRNEKLLYPEEALKRHRKTAKQYFDS